MLASLVPVIFQTIILPELGRWLASRGAGAAFPSETEINAQMNLIHDSIVNAADAFLKSKGAL